MRRFGRTACACLSLALITAQADGLAQPEKQEHLLKKVTFKQPDLEWFFDTAATSPENRTKVLELIAHAPQSARDLFRLGEEDGKIVWWWQRLTLLAKKQ